MKFDVAAHIRYVLPFARHLVRRFCEDRCLMVASELAYTTLLALVPLMAVAFSVLAAFPVFQQVVADIQNFIFKNFVPAFGEVVESYLLEFVRQATGLTALGVLFLVITALMMMATIERAFNDIWRVRARRKAVSSFLVYWAVLTLGPMLIGTSLIVTSYLVSLPLFSDAESVDVRAHLLRVMPFLSTTLAFGLLYVVVPNRVIPWLYALVGALVAAVLFDLSNRGFALYVTHYAAYQRVYGAFAAVPVFLVWIYVSWVVILLGVEITHSLTTFRASLTASPAQDRGLELVCAVRLIGHLWMAQSEGQSVPTVHLLRSEPLLAEPALDALMEKLEEGRMVQRTADGKWALARDVSEVTLLDLFRSQAYVLPDLGASWGGPEDPWTRNLRQTLSEATSCIEDSMRVPLRTLYVRGPRDQGAHEKTGFAV
jgi:membrane protein